MDLSPPVDKRSQPALANTPLDGHYGVIKTFTTTLVWGWLCIRLAAAVTYQIAKRRVQSLMERIVTEHRAIRRKSAHPIWSIRCSP
jgi:hypothetical protein